MPIDMTKANYSVAFYHQKFLGFSIVIVITALIPGFVRETKIWPNSLLYELGEAPPLIST